MQEDSNIDAELRQLLALTGLTIEAERIEGVAHLADRELNELAEIDPESLSEEEFSDHCDCVGIHIWLRVLSRMAVRGILCRSGRANGAALTPKQTLDRIFELLQSTASYLIGEDNRSGEPENPHPSTTQ